VAVIFSCSIWAGSARGEAVLRLDHPANKSAAKKSKKKFSPPAKALRDDRELDTFAAYLLGGKRDEPKVAVVTHKKKPATGVEWGDQHAHNIHLKHPKSAHKAPPSRPLLVSNQIDSTLPPVIPMAPLSMEMPSSVPAPKTLWAGLGMLAVMGCWRWFVARRLEAE
jgi:hypothetical protein